MNEDRSNLWLALGLLVLWGCEAKTPLDSQGESQGDNSSSGGRGGGGASNSEDTAAGYGDARVTGDPGPSCSMSASQYDSSCNVDSDCVLVPEGAPCDGNCLSVCPTSALNARVAYQYLADLKALMAEHNESPVCMCDCYAGPYCCHGICYSQCGGCSMVPQWQ
jgi:hypothetical protein